MGRSEGLAVVSQEPNRDRGVEVAEGQNAAPDRSERDTTISLHQRIWRAAGDIGKLEKDKETSEKIGGYSYITHDQVSMKAKAAFQKYGVMVIPTIQSREQDGNRTCLTVSVDFVNVDNPSDKITIQSVGYGADNSDKGPGKAYSYAMKYAYMKLLMLNSADDIEDANVEYQAPVSQALVAQEAVGKKKTVEAWANSYRDALNGARDQTELKRIQRENREQLMSDDLPEVTRDFFIDLFETKKQELS